MIKAYCFDNQKDWDDGIHLLLFAARGVQQESIKFQSFSVGVLEHSAWNVEDCKKESVA